MALTEENIVHVPKLLSRWVRLGSGAKAHYVTSGETGPAVVLLHGGIIGSSGTAGWRFMAPFLGTNGFRVYCPDMPAFGLTEDPGNSYPAGEAGHLDFIHDFATAVCLDRFHIAGNSMGCSNSVNYIVAHPERIISFVLIAGSIGDLVPPADLLKLRGRAQDARADVEFDGTEESMRRLMESIVMDPSKISDDLVKMRTVAANRNRETYKAHMDAAMKSLLDPDPNTAAKFRTKDRLDKIRIPGIYLYGRDDALLPVEAAYPQEDALPNVQFFYPEETGHQGQTDQPELFNQVFLEFFRDGKVSWGTAQRAGISGRRPPNPNLVAVPAAKTPVSATS